MKELFSNTPRRFKAENPWQEERVHFRAPASADLSEQENLEMECEVETLGVEE